jgi:acyl-CoA synthetase (AMP-forming)/AMP-acid ligase II
MLGYLDGAAPAEWVATGDLVELADDRVRLRGRANDTINVGGFKVNPAEVEAIVREVAGVAEACVVGHKSSISGQLVKVVLCVAPGTDPAAIKREVTRRCSERLPGHMTPRLFEVVDRLETSMAQKLVRRT